ncbi:branched-chain amino acid transport system II carrier protein [Bacillus spongiae]|uniref:Branched-chain amino acid transport system carrier protein n=1 Tax=Bacillus spongiae TaxID=2683610 RepID=A0ABU8HCE8_9BACI
MNSKKLSWSEILTIGLMLFALFLGAGNMIFPPFLGQEAGTNVWIAIIGFLLTGVGLPLLGVIAIAKSGGDLQSLGTRVHPLFGIVFTIVVYLAIGPLFGIPRTGTVAYEIGVTPFLNESVLSSKFPLFFFTIIFFSITAWLSMNPSKLVDRIGKLLTPALLIILTILVTKSIMFPMGSFQVPAVDYQTEPLFKGFLEGYLTMDTIGALVFGIVVINSIKSKGVTSPSAVTKICTIAGLIAATGLSLVYLALSFMGATATEAIGVQENGGAILTAVANYLYGSLGAIILALAITFACLTTSVGLVSSCAQYFKKIMPKVSYPLFVIVLSLFSMVIANVGLTQLIQISIPILIMIYPVAIMLILLSFIHNAFQGYRAVYIGSLLPTFIISFIDGLKTAGVNVTAIADAFTILPLFEQGVGWFIPAIIGAIIGYGIAILSGESKKLVKA